MAYPASLNPACSIPDSAALAAPPLISAPVSAPLSALAPASQAADAFAAIEPSSGAPAVATVRFRREAAPVVFTITHVGNSLDDLVGDDRVRRQLDKVVAAIYRMDVREIDIKGYYP